MKISQLVWCLGFLFNGAAVAQDLAVLPPDQEDPSVMMDHPPEGQFTVIGPVVRGFAWDKDAPNAKVSVRLSIIPNSSERMSRAGADTPLKTIERIANVDGAYSKGVSSGGHDFVFRIYEELADVDAARLKDVLLRLEITNVSPYGAPGAWVSGAVKSANLAACMRPGQDPAVITRKVLLIELDPICHSRGGKRFSQVCIDNNAERAGTPQDLSKLIVDAFREDSGGIMNFQLLPTEYDPEEWPVMRWRIDEGRPAWLTSAPQPGPAPTASTDDPYQYGERWAVADIEAHRQVRWFRPEKDLREAAFDYDKFIAKHKLEARHAAGEFDEVWIYGWWGCGTWEATMGGGARPYHTNSAPLGNPATSGRPFNSSRGIHIMGFNWGRGRGEALESFGHRMEGTLSDVFGDYLKAGADHAWARFARCDKRVEGKAGVGDMHYPPQATKDYDWQEPRWVQSACDDWLLWPNMRGETSVVNHREYMDAYPDLVDIDAYHRWWFAHLPRAQGSTDGRLNDWWQYFAYPDLVMQEPSHR